MSPQEKSILSPLPPPSFNRFRIAVEPTKKAIPTCINGFHWFGVCPRLVKNVSDDKNAITVFFSILMY